MYTCFVHDDHAMKIIIIKFDKKKMKQNIKA